MPYGLIEDLWRGFGASQAIHCQVFVKLMSLKSYSALLICFVVVFTNRRTLLFSAY